MLLAPTIEHPGAFCLFLKKVGVQRAYRKPRNVSQGPDAASDGVTWLPGRAAWLHG